jgi:hypothetical protein
VLFHLQGDLPNGKSMVADKFGFCVLTHRSQARETDLVTWVPRNSWSSHKEGQWGEQVDAGDILLEVATDDLEE